MAMSPSINHVPWLTECLEGKKESFPFHLDRSCVGTLSEYEGHYSNSCFPQIEESQKKPFYLVNLPYVPPDLSSYNHLNWLIEQFKNNAFGHTPEECHPEVTQRLALVIGINQMRSLDKERNTQFKTWIQNIPKVQDIALRIIGFFWKPQWKEKNEPSSHAPKEAFALLKAQNPQIAESIRIEEEDKSSAKRAQIPFQHIRQRILESNGTKEFVFSFFIKPEKPLYLETEKPFYLSIMDDDFEDFRTQKKGHFSYYDALCAAYQQQVSEELKLPSNGMTSSISTPIKSEKSSQKYLQTVFSHSPLEKIPIEQIPEKLLLGYTVTWEKKFPSVMSTGYEASSKAPILLKLAAQVDMRIRNAMAAIIPCSPYYQEYSLMVLIESQQHYLRFSFLKQGMKEDLESRRILYNGIRAGIIDRDRMLFFPEGAIRTAVAKRFETDTVKKVSEITRKNIGQKGILSAIRGKKQTLAFPSFRARCLYLALQEKIHCNDKRSAMKYISGLFFVFDPLCICHSRQLRPHSRYKASDFFSFIEHYSVYKEQMQSAITLALAKKEIPENHFSSFIDKFFTCSESKDKKQADETLRRLAKEFIENLENLGLDESTKQKVKTMSTGVGKNMAEFFQEQIQKLN